MIEKNSFYKIKLVTLVVANLFLTQAEAQNTKPSIKDLTKKESHKNEEENSSPISSNQSDGINKHSIGIGVGETFLFSSFEKNGENSITGEFFYSYSASHSYDFLLNLHFSTHEYKETKTSLFGVVPSIKGKLWQFDSFSPYVLAGLGFYRPQLTRYVGTAIIVILLGLYCNITTRLTSNKRLAKKLKALTSNYFLQLFILFNNETLIPRNRQRRSRKNPFLTIFSALPKHQYK